MDTKGGATVLVAKFATKRIGSARMVSSNLPLFGGEQTAPYGARVRPSREVSMGDQARQLGKGCHCVPGWSKGVSNEPPTAEGHGAIGAP